MTKKDKTSASYEMIAKALFDTYESIYEIELDTGAYKCYHQSDTYEELLLHKQGKDFFKELPAGIKRIVIPRDQAYVLRMLRKDFLISQLKKEKFYSISYGVHEGNREVYHKLRATISENEHGQYILVGIRDIDELKRHEREREALEKELEISRTKSLTSQMHPHFLYNALGSIQEVILEDPIYAAELLEDFTLFLRGCVRALNSDALISFSQEMENIRAYGNIEKMRFGKKLKIREDLSATEFFILPLSIQPLVENAIKHGIYNRGPKGGEVVIRTLEDDKQWIIQVEDNGVGFDVDKVYHQTLQGKRDSTGLYNTTFRLDKIMHATVDIKSKPDNGTCVTISIPKGGHEQ